MKAYRAVIHAQDKGERPYRQLLLGGVLAHYSSPFEEKQHAEDFAEAIVQGNRSAGILVGTVEIKEVNASSKSVIKASEVAAAGPSQTSAGSVGLEG